MTRLAFCISIFLITISSCSFGMGFNDGCNRTPGGNTIHSNGGLFLMLKNDSVYEGLHTWYFYKNHMVCTLDNPRYYLVVDEINLLVYRYEDYSSLTQALQEHDLIPRFWQRDFNGLFFTLDNLSFYVFCNVFWLLPAFVLFVWLLYSAIKFERFSVSQPRTIMVLMVIAIALIRLFLMQYPQSF